VLTNTAIKSIGIVRQHIFGIPVEREFLFSDHKGAYKSSIENRQRKLIIKMSFLRKFLKDGERVFLITTGYSPASLFEKYIVGWFFIYLKRSVFIFTDRRIIHVPTTPMYTYRNSIAHIPYAGCRSISMKGKNLIVEYTEYGRIDKFFSISGREKKKIIRFLEEIKKETTKIKYSGRKHLCPQCGHILTDGVSACPNCQLKFKTKPLAIAMSLLFPGGGYFYTRQHFLGIIGAIIDLILMGFTAYHLFNFLNGNDAALYKMILFGCGFLLEKIFTSIHVSGFIKEFIPKKSKIK
jgi:hypothetical protein